MRHRYYLEYFFGEAIRLLDYPNLSDYSIVINYFLIIDPIDWFWLFLERMSL